MRSTPAPLALAARARKTASLALALSLGIFSVWACSSDSAARTCTVNADCASGQCRADGTCAPTTSNEEAGIGADAGTDDPNTGKDGGADSPVPLLDSGLCTPNADGVITVDEVPLRAGLKGTFRVTTSGVKVSTAGTSAGGDAGGSSGKRWDFSGELTGDHGLLLETMPLTGQWFENDYPGASYAARLSDTSDYLGIFATTAGALELRGVVSPASGSGQTKIAYDPSVPTLSFPLQKGKKWEVTSTASGDIPVTFNVSYTEKYTFEVIDEGELKTSTALNPFKVLRVNVLIKKTPAFSLISYYTRSYVYVAECFGAVAKVVSAADQLSEPPIDFTDATEVQRLAP